MQKKLETYNHNISTLVHGTADKILIKLIFSKKSSDFFSSTVSTKSTNVLKDKIIIETLNNIQITGGKGSYLCCQKKQRKKIQISF